MRDLIWRFRYHLAVFLRRPWTRFYHCGYRQRFWRDLHLFRRRYSSLPRWTLLPTH